MGAATDVWRDRVAEAIDGGTPLREVEAEVIEHAPLTDDSRDALWLYAWGLSQDRGEGRAQRLPRW